MQEKWSADYEWDTLEDGSSKVGVNLDLQLTDTRTDSFDDLERVRTTVFDMVMHSIAPQLVTNAGVSLYDGDAKFRVDNKFSSKNRGGDDYVGTNLRFDSVIETDAALSPLQAFYVSRFSIAEATATAIVDHLKYQREGRVRSKWNANYSVDGDETTRHDYRLVA